MREGNVLSVTQLNEYVSTLIRNDMLLGSVSIRGEISGFKRHSSGHIYFSMKDESSVVRCVMFRQNAMSLDRSIGDGMQVTASGYASLYTRDGQFQFYVKSIEREGEDELYRRFSKLKTRLESQGLFAKEHKKPIPMLPKCLGVVTSATGAAIQDIINITRRRYPAMDILLSPASVQGAGAAKEIADAIRLLDGSGKADVIIVGRGGGSIEELWAFNEEIVAKAIYACKTPIVSAVGHETDFTIADFAADLRAPTPSAAAELCVPEYEALNDELEYMRDEMVLACRRAIAEHERSIDSIEKGGVFSSCAHALSLAGAGLSALQGALDSAVASGVSGAEHSLCLTVAKIESIAPERTLERGFAIIKNKSGFIGSVEAVAAGDDVSIAFFDGEAEASIKTAAKGGGKE